MTVRERHEGLLDVVTRSHGLEGLERQPRLERGELVPGGLRYSYLPRSGAVGKSRKNAERSPSWRRTSVKYGPLGLGSSE